MKKIIDEKGRLFGRISVIDIIVVIVVAVLCMAIYTRFFTKTETSTVQNDEFTYQIVVEGVRESTADIIRVGDKLYSTENGTEIGTIAAVEVSDAEETVAMADGTYKNVVVEGRYDVLVTVDALGVISEGRCYAGRTFEISVNEEIEIATKYCETTAVVWSIEK